MKNQITEIIRDSGEVRGFILRTMAGIKSGEISIEKGMTIAALGKVADGMMQTELRKIQIQVALPETYKHLIDSAAMGKTLIGNSGPIYDGVGERDV